METLEQKRKRQREWVAARRKMWFDANGPCKHCGSWKKLEIHHVDPTTKIAHTVFSWSQVKRDAELRKCIVLCEDCHWKITQKAIKKARPVHHIHGTNTEYRRGCRCEPCKQAKYAEVDAYRKRQQVHT